MASSREDKTVRIAVTPQGLPVKAVGAHPDWMYTDDWLGDITTTFPQFSSQGKYVKAMEVAEHIKAFFQEVLLSYPEEYVLASTEPFIRFVPEDFSDDPYEAAGEFASFLGKLFQDLFELIYIPEQVQVPASILEDIEAIIDYGIENIPD